MLFSFAFGTLQGIAQTSAGRHACIRVAVDAVGQVGRIPNLSRRRSRLLGSFCNHLAGEQALIEHSSKRQRAVSPTDHSGPTKRPVPQLMSRLAQPPMRQGPALPAHFAGVKEEDRPVLAQIAFNLHAGNVLRRERIVALQPEGGFFIRCVGIEVTVGGHMNPVVTASFRKSMTVCQVAFEGLRSRNLCCRIRSSSMCRSCCAEGSLFSE